MSKKRNEDPDLLKNKNIIRGAIDKRLSIEKFRSSSTPDLLFPVSQWSTGWLSSMGILGNIRPRYLGGLSAVPLLPPADLSSELAWLDGILRKSEEAINLHVDLTKRFETGLLSHCEGASSEVLEKANSSLGYTMTWLASTVAHKQYFEGLEAQKTFVAGLASQGATRFTLFFAYWWSIRAEGRTTAQHYVFEILRRIKDWDLDAKAEAHLKYYLLNSIPDVGAENELLAVASSGTAIDAYEIFLSICEVSIAEQRSIVPQLKASLIRISRSVVDHRVIKLLLATGDSKLLSELPTPCISVKENALTGQLSESDFENVDTISGLATVAEKVLYKTNNIFINELITGFNGLPKSDDTGADALERLSKIGLVFGHIPLGRWLSGMVSCNSLDVPPFSKRHLAVMFINATDALFEASSILDVSAADAYYKQILHDRAYPAITAVVNTLQYGLDANETCSEIPSEDVLKYELQYFLRERDKKKVLEKAIHLEKCSPTKVAIYYKYSTMMDLLGITAVLDSAVDILIENESYIKWMPSNQMLDEIYSEEVNAHPEKVQTSIFLQIFENYCDSTISSFTAYAAEDYVLHNCVEKPTQLRTDWFDSSPNLARYYFHKVCNIPRLKHFLAFDSEKEVENERIEICLLLSNNTGDKTKEFSEEARNIVTARLIKEAQKELHASKISIDATEIRKWATKNLREEFLRYKEFLKTGLVPVGDEFRRLLLESLEKGTLAPELFELPENEAITLFKDLVNRYVYQCVNDSEHGLDCYLSLRIRHGTLSGMIRSAAEQENVVTRKTDQSGNYLENEYWKNILRGLPVDGYDAIDLQLKEFSKELDSLIEDVTVERIQINGTEKPDGLFRVSVKPIQINTLATEIDIETSFDEFLTKIEELFWSVVEVNLSSVREYIDTEYRMSIDALLSKYEEWARLDGELVFLADALLRTKNQTSVTLDQVRDWFFLPSATSSTAFTIEEMIAVSLETLQKFHQEFNPVINLETDDLPPFLNALHLFSDLFSVIFDNIYKHSGSIEPTIEILSWIEERKLYFEISNTLADSVDAVSVRNDVRNRCDQLKANKLVSAVRQEGGTGLPKLAKLVGLSNSTGELDADVEVEARKFVLKFSVEATLIATEAEQEESAHEA